MPESSVEEKVAAIFRELAGERAEVLDGSRVAENVTSAITAAIMGNDQDEAHEVAFHLTDWHAEAAFLVALHLFPERFTKEEIEEGVIAFLIHAPHHIIAAARLKGFSVEDIFDEDDGSA